MKHEFSKKYFVSSVDKNKNLFLPFLAKVFCLRVR